MTRVAVIGAGSWGTALAIAAAEAGSEGVTLWGRRPDQVASMRATRRNEEYLPGVVLPEAIRPTSHLAEALAEAEVALLVAPAQGLRAVAEAMAPHAPDGLPVAICAKGIELSTGKRLSQVLGEAMPRARLAILSGPTFAGEVARGLPAAIVCASADAQARDAIVAALARPVFRPYLSDDVVGVELAGAAKNVLAIACGMVAGMALGENARAALITRALAELARLIRALGGKTETAMGLAGMGDLVLTASSPTSRNMSLGLALGQGQALADVLGARHGVTEGVKTAPALRALADARGVDMPIVAAVDDVLTRGAAPAEAMRALLARPIREETAARIGRDMA